MADFQQLDIASRQFNITLDAERYMIHISQTGVDAALADLQALRDILTTRVNELALHGITAIQHSLLKRARSSGFPTPYQWEGGTARDSSSLITGWQRTLSIMAEAPRIEHGKATFLDIARMNKVRLLDIRTKSGGASGLYNPSAGWTPSDYDVVWKIAEFGTGIYASPNRRLTGRAKVPGGGGAWFLRPFSKSVEVFGQRGVHFLFGTRGPEDQNRKDARLAELAISRKIASILRGGRA